MPSRGPELAEVLAETWSVAAAGETGPVTFGPIDEEAQVLLVGRSSDEHLSSISDELRRRRIASARIAVESGAGLPDLRTNAAGHHGGRWDGIVFREASAAVPLAHHNERTARVSTAGLPPETRSFAHREAAAAVTGWLDAQEAEAWVNEHGCSQRASNKLRQLRLAANCGLAVPDTLATSSPEAAVEMLAERPAGVVIKSLDDPFVWQRGDMAGFLYTSELLPAHEKLLSRISHPVLLQEKLEIESELRVTVVGARCFSARIRGPRGQLDWRRGIGSGELRYERCQLEADTEAKVVELVHRLGLSYAAVDFAETPGGTVFFEANPSGAYLWLEQGLGMPITAAICDAVSGA